MGHASFEDLEVWKRSARLHVYITQRIGVLSDSPASALIAAFNEISAMLHSLIKSLKLKS
jgi:hypothetical protein